MMMGMALMPQILHRRCEAKSMLKTTACEFCSVQLCFPEH